MTSSSARFSFRGLGSIGVLIGLVCLALALPSALGRSGAEELGDGGPEAGGAPGGVEAAEAARRSDVRAAEERRWLCALAAAVNEAHENCELLDLSPGPEVWLRLDFRRATAAIEENPLVHAGTYGELPALIGTLRFLESYRRASSDARALDALMSERDYSEEDIRFLAGFIHWYLNCAYRHWRGRFEVDPLIGRALGHEAHDTGFDVERLRAFKGKDFETLLGEMD